MSSYHRQQHLQCSIPCLMLTFIVFSIASANSLSSGGQRQPQVHSQNESQNGNKKLDCGMRRLFLEMAQQKAVPWRTSTEDIFDALELGSRCNDVYDDTRSTMNRLRDNGVGGSTYHAEKEEDTDHIFYVSPNNGNDENSGSQTHPFLTIHRALEATRNVSLIDDNNMSTARRKSIMLYPGIHFLKETITLKPPLDSHLTIRDESDGESTAWISGGFPIDSETTDWQRSPSNKNIWVADLTPIIDDSITSITGLFTTNPHTRMTLARYPNADVEDWNATGRYIPAINLASNTTDDYEWLFPPYSDVPEFYSIDLTQPNNPTGSTKNDSSMIHYNWFGTGKGGACAKVWGDEPSYWCSNISAGGWAFVDRAAAEAGRPNIPIGLTINNATLIKRFTEWNSEQSKNPRGAVFHVQHTQSWSWHMFNVSHVDDSIPSKLTVFFDKGGSQGGRNWQCIDGSKHLSDCNGDNKKLRSGAWYVEGVFEELDQEGEFYYDSNSKLLYYYPDHDASCNGADDPTFASIGRRLGPQNHTNPSHCIPDIIATNLQTLIKLEGTMDDPLQGVQLIGLGFRDAAKTIMEQWGVPSGGDWALHRGGALHLDGTENVTISDCYFRKLDGNAIMLSSYNRYTHVTRSEFSWIGNGAMATWGDTRNGYDATEGAQPRYSVIENNIVSNIGLYQKQSSAWGQNKACHNTIRNNVVFNVPRAAINFNDHLGGGNIVQGNVLFNTVRESGDHGAINSWDRLPFLSDSGTGPSFTPLPTHTFGNLVMANYHADQGFDNDDGSSWYYTHDNVFFSDKASGFKMDYGGHSSAFTSNLVYGKSCYGTGDFLNKNLADTLQNNTCINDEKNTTQEIIFGHLFQCSLDGMVPANNTYYSKSGNGTFVCGNESRTIQGMQQEGYEIGSTIGTTPDERTIISWARDILDQHVQKHEGDTKKHDSKKTALIFTWAIGLFFVILGVLAMCYFHRDEMKTAWSTIRQCACGSQRASSPPGVNGSEPLLEMETEFFL